MYVLTLRAAEASLPSSKTVLGKKDFGWECILGHMVEKKKVNSMVPYSLNPYVCHREKCTENTQVIANRRITVTNSTFWTIEL